MILSKNYHNYFIFSIFLLFSIFKIYEANNEYREQPNIFYKISNLNKEDIVKQMDKKFLKPVERQSYLSSNIKANIYVIADGSINVLSNIYADIFTNFLMGFFNNFEINPSYVNVAFTMSPGDNNMWLYLPSFNSFYGNTSLRDYIHSSYYPLDGSQSFGQGQLKDMLKMALNNQFLKTGYNDSYKPHIIFYLTTTSSPDYDAIYQSNIIRNSNKFKIISIGYQTKNNVYALQSMSDCFYRADTEDDLSALSSALASLVTYASNSGIELQC
uniref:VWFA domain-containing protein n=1 Tax=Strongyloides venezuelensis TaxID=75913 RepID=A0A0K0FDW8_STRVS